MAQTIDLLKNSSFEQKMDSLKDAIIGKNNDYNTVSNKPSINGYTLEGNKTNIQLGIPIKLSELTNDKNFIDNTVNNLLNYYNKGESYNKTEVNTLLNNVVGLNIKIVNVLPTTEISRNTIYLILKESPNENNIYDEYINIDGDITGWEKIGSTEVNLQNYYTKTEIDSKISNIPNVTTNDQTPTYTEVTVLGDLTSGEKLSLAFGKLKLAVKNLKTLITLIGTTDISSIGGGTITGGVKDLDSRLTQLNGEMKFCAYHGVHRGDSIPLPFKPVRPLSAMIFPGFNTKNSFPYKFGAATITVGESSFILFATDNQGNILDISIPLDISVIYIPRSY